jgi:hypothetical protein
MLALAGSVRSTVPVHSCRLGDAQGLQPLHPACDVYGRQHGETLWAFPGEIAQAIATVDNVSLACMNVDSHLLESLDGGLAIIEFSLQIRCTDLEWPGRRP